MRRWKKASMTVEASYIVPVILMMFLMIVYLVFYFHDKDVLTGAAYEVAVVGAQNVRQDPSYDVQDLAALYWERIRGKCILFSDVAAEAEQDDHQIIVEVTAARGKMRIQTRATAHISQPEQAIYRVKKWKEVIEP